MRSTTRQGQGCHSFSHNVYQLFSFICCIQACTITSTKGNIYISVPRSPCDFDNSPVYRTVEHRICFLFAGRILPLTSEVVGIYPTSFEEGRAFLERHPWLGCFLFLDRFVDSFCSVFVHGLTFSLIIMQKFYLIRFSVLFFAYYSLHIKCRYYLWFGGRAGRAHADLSATRKRRCFFFVISNVLLGVFYRNTTSVPIGHPETQHYCLWPPHYE